jgi:rhodanese-related sulfurtransferase
MKCECINTCDFIRCMSKVMPFTTVMAKAKYCENTDYGCAIYLEHEVLDIDKETGKLYPGYVAEGLEIFGKHYSESYKRLCVRYRETTRVSDVDSTIIQEVAMTPDQIRAVDVKGMMDSGKEIALLDVRSSKEWGESEVKLPGAIRIHITEIDKYLEKIPKNIPVITYCTCRHEKLSVRVTQILFENGFNNALFLLGGFDAWVSAGYPLECK